MHSEWKQKKLYPVLGFFTMLSFLYLNLYGNLSFEFPVVFWSLPKMGFVGVNHTRFVLLHHESAEPLNEVYINGWNSYWLMEESIGGPSRRRVSEMLKRGAHMGLTVCRTWAFSDGPGPNSLQIRPGVFNERLFKVFFLLFWIFFINIRINCSLYINFCALIFILCSGIGLCDSGSKKTGDKINTEPCEQFERIWWKSAVFALGKGSWNQCLFFY